MLSYSIHLNLQLGQALSTRPDIVPTVYCQELAKLQVWLPSSTSDSICGLYDLISQLRLYKWDFIIFYLFSWSYSSSPSLIARIKFHHFQLMLQLNQLNPSWVALLHKYLLTLVQSLLLQRLWDRCIKVR